jgi:hypothetical protein
MTDGTRRELKELEILQVIRRTCRESDIILVERYGTDDPERTTVAFEYHRSCAPKIRRLAAGALTAVSGVITAYVWHRWGVGWQLCLSLAAVAYNGMIWFVEALREPIKSDELLHRIDAALEFAGFDVNRTPTSWRVLIPDDNNEGEEWKSPRGTSGA